MTEKNNDKSIIGWREWITLPDLNIKYIKAKIDTGARTSTLHAFNVKPFREKGVERVRFLMHPLQKNLVFVTECFADVIDKRWVTDSGGHREKRFVISTTAKLGDLEWPVEMTLTNRDTMKFRMLLGRTAMHHLLVVDPSKSYLMGKPPKKLRLK